MQKTCVLIIIIVQIVSSLCDPPVECPGPGYIWQSNGHCCGMVYCMEDHEVTPCEVNNDNDTCTRCPPGSFMPDKTNSRTITECVFRKCEQGHTRVIDYSAEARDPHACPSYCECDITYGYCGTDPCNCRKQSCGFGKRLLQNCGCDPVKKSIQTTTVPESEVTYQNSAATSQVNGTNSAIPKSSKPTTTTATSTVKEPSNTTITIMVPVVVALALIVAMIIAHYLRRNRKPETVNNYKYIFKKVDNVQLGNGTRSSVTQIKEIEKGASETGSLDLEEGDRSSVSFLRNNSCESDSPGATGGIGGLDHNTDHTTVDVDYDTEETKCKTVDQTSSTLDVQFPPLTEQNGGIPCYDKCPETGTTDLVVYVVMEPPRQTMAWISAEFSQKMNGNALPVACVGRSRKFTEKKYFVEHGGKKKNAVIFIVICTIISEFLRSVYDRTYKCEEQNNRDNTKKMQIVADKLRMITASKLHTMFSDTIAAMSLSKKLRQFCSEMHVRPDVLWTVYPVYGQGVGPTIERFLSPNPPTRLEFMSNELLRLCTFHNYPLARIVSCLRMAKAGLFYSGNGDEVSCYSCEKNMRGWQHGSDPFEVHRLKSPACYHMRCMDERNVAVGTVAAPKGSATESRNTTDNTSSQTRNTLSVPTASATSTGSEKSDESGYGTGSTASTSSKSYFSESTPVMVSTSDNNAKVTTPSEETDIAGNDDNNTQQSVSNSSVDDNTSQVTEAAQTSQVTETAQTAHGQVTDTAQTSQVTDTAQTSQVTETAQTSQVTETAQTAQTAVSAPATTYGSMADPPRSRAFYPDYVLMADRLRTFNTWSATIRQTPQQMVDSGFYYAGYEDCVRCFQCGIGLRNWEPPDNPHVEHARWSPRCAFLLQAKGVDFINLVMEAVAHLEARRNNPDPVTTQTTTHTSNNNTVTSPAQTQCQNNSGTPTTRTATPTATSDTTSATPAVTSGTPPATRTDAPTPASRISSATPATTSSATPTPTCTATPSATPTPTCTATPSATPTAKADIPAPKHTQGSSAGGKTDDRDRSCKPKTQTKDTKDPHDINETLIRDAIKQGPMHQRPGLLGGAKASSLDQNPADDTEKMKRENREMRERTICKICLEGQVSIAFIPCGHLVACGQCAQAITRCAVCRKPIQNKILTHLDV